jgi:uncharacterized membrane protein
MEEQNKVSFSNNITYRNRVSIVTGIILAELLRKYLLNSVIDFTSINRKFIGEVFETIYVVLLTVTMILSVYLLYPVFKKK